MNKLTGKVAVITGASKAIGAAIAKSLAAERGIGRRQLRPPARLGRNPLSSPSPGWRQGCRRGWRHITNASDVQGVIDAAMKAYGRLDILVNNAGFYEFAPLEAITEESFHKLFNINVLGLLLVTRAAEMVEASSTLDPALSAMDRPEPVPLKQSRRRLRSKSPRT